MGVFGGQVAAAALAGMAAWAWCRPPPDVLLHRRLGLHVDGSAAAGSSAGFAALGLVWPGFPRRWPGLRADGAELEVRRTATIELCVALADELRAGRLPSDALVSAAGAGVDEGRGFVEHAVTAAHRGDPVAPALVRDADRPGADGLRLIAACWSVAEQHGGALAAALDRVASTLRAREMARRRIALELAAPKATARLLAALPVLGLLIGTASGADPLGVLIGTGWGWALLAAGIGLDLAGIAWVGRIARTAERAG